ncbi:MAG: CBS domain-containing protein [Alphaproteobacteria bacterium]
MRVSQMMTPSVCVAHPDQTVREAAMLMASHEVGALPVGLEDRLVGILTDRDIVARAVAIGLSPDECSVRDVMTPEVKFIFADEDVDDVVRNFATLQVRRLPVLDRDKRLVGIVSVADLAMAAGPDAAGPAIEGVSRP